MIMGDQLKLQTAKRGATIAVMSVSLLGTGVAAQAAPGPNNSDVAGTQATGARTGYAGEKLAGTRAAKRLINVRSIGSKCGKTAIATAEGKGKMTLRIDDTRSAGTVLSKDITASAGSISVGVGWDVSKTRSITVSGSKEVPRGKYGTLKAYVKYSGKSSTCRKCTGPIRGRPSGGTRRPTNRSASVSSTASGSRLRVTSSPYLSGPPEILRRAASRCGPKVAVRRTYLNRGPASIRCCNPNARPSPTILSSMRTAATAPRSTNTKDLKSFTPRPEGRSAPLS